MAKNKGETLTWQVSNPERTRYYLYQAIAYARKHGHKLYKDLGNRYHLKIKSGKLTATLKVAANFELILDGVTLLDIVTAVQNHSDQNLLFPDANLSETELIRLASWCNIRYLSLIETAKGLIITPNAEETTEASNGG